MSLLRWFLHPEISAAEIRAEIWRLGGRHQGEPLAGALAELKVAGLPRQRAELLRAVVHQLKS